MSDEYSTSSLNQGHKVEPINPRDTLEQQSFGSGTGNSRESSYNESSYSGGNSAESAYNGYSDYNGQSSFSGQNGYSGQSGYFSGSSSPYYSYSNPGNRTSGGTAYTENAQKASADAAGNNRNNINNINNRNDRNNPGKTNRKPEKTKQKKDSFLKKLGRTAVLAAVFGIISGGIFLGINKGAGILFGNDTETVSEKQEDAVDTPETETADNKKEATESGEDTDKAADAKQDTDSASDDKAAAETKSDEDEVDVQQIAQSSATATLDYDVAGIVEMAQPSIVSITTTGTEVIQSYFQQYERPTSGAGSGIIIGQDDTSLMVATNYHVIKGADDIKVGFNDGEVVDATVRGYDEEADIALVLVPLSDMKDSTKDAVTVASVGDSSALQVGEPAIAIGNALGYGQSVTVGYISALNRNIEGSDGSFIQTDAAINPGNSGGALINSKGEVIGINSVKYVDSTVEGMGFSIPINEAMSIINDIASGEQKEKAELGVSGVDITREYSMIYGFPMGVYVREIEDGSSADESELHTGDIIVEIDGEEVYTIDELQELMSKKSAGDTVEMVVYRANSMGFYEEKTITVTLK